MKNLTLLILGAGFCLGAWQALGSGEQKTYDEFYAMAAKAFANGEYEKALENLAQAEKVRPNQTQSHNLRGAIYLKRKEFEKAKVSFQKALRFEPHSKMFRYNLAQVYFDQKLYSEAKKLLEPIYEENKNDQQTLYMLFLCNLLLNNKSSVQKILASIKKDSETPLFDYCHAAKEFQESNPANAMKFVESAFRDYSHEQNANFSYPLIELGYLKGESVGLQPQKTEK